MAFYKQVSLDLSPAQMRKAANLQPIQLSKEQVASNAKKIYVHPENYKKIMAAKMKGTGCRIMISPDAMKYDMDELQGGSVWGWLKDKAWPWLKKNVLPALADVAVPAATTFLGVPQSAPVVRGAIKDLTGIGMKKGSKDMKLKMAALRAMKKNKMQGGSFKLN